MAGRAGAAAASPLTRSSPAGEVVLGYVRLLDDLEALHGANGTAGWWRVVLLCGT
jgi:hypothetical protein